MKKIITILMLAVIIPSYSQAKKKVTKKPIEKEVVTTKPKEWILDSDIKVINGKRAIYGAEIYLPDADKKLIKINFSMMCDSIRYKEHGIDAAKINEMIIKSNLNAMFGTKNRYTYVPKELNLIYDMKEYQWMAILTYTAQNDYGAIKTGTSTSLFSGFGYFLEHYNR